MISESCIVYNSRLIVKALEKSSKLFSLSIIKLVWQNCFEVVISTDTILPEVQKLLLFFIALPKFFTHATFY